MSRKKTFFKLYGLQARFALSLILSLFLCVGVFCLLYYSTDYIITGYISNTEFQQKQLEKQAQSLQDYITKNSISSTDLQKLEKWAYRHPIILLELYSEDKCIYSSVYDIHSDPDHGLYYIGSLAEQNNRISINLSDMQANVLMYSDFSYQYYTLGKLFSLLVSLAILVVVFINNNHKLIRYICRLNEETQILEGGNLEYQVSVEGNDEVTDLARSINRMRESFIQQMETEQHLQQSNKKLVTEMSHDIRTPLTSIMLYLEILRSHHYSSEEELKNYLDKIYVKTHHMKNMTDHLFEYAKNSPKSQKIKLLSMKSAFETFVNDLETDLKEHNYKTNTNLQWEQCYLQIIPEYLDRIRENTFSNILKYADPAADIIINTISSDDYCGFSIINVCKKVTDHYDSNSIGIESIKSMMNEMNAICTVEQTDTLFEIALLFPKQ